MKEINKEIRAEVKRKILEVGGTDKLLNKHVTEIIEKFCGKNYIFNDFVCDVCTTVDNQIYYFRYSKGM